MNSTGATSECLSFPDQSPVQPYHCTHMSADEFNQSPVESKHHGGEEDTCLSDSHGGENSSCLNDSGSDSESMASDSQLEVSSDYSEKSESSQTNGSEAAQAPVQSSGSSNLAKDLLAFFSSERGGSLVASAVRQGFGLSDDPVDDT